MSDLVTPFSHRKSEPEESVLYIVGTPIGNLNDISKRSINILENVSLILCEDTRKTGILLNSLGISNKLISFNDFNASTRLTYIFSELEKKKSIALVSDAGTPLISDPGELLVKKVKEAHFDVISIPGPCAAISALVTSGLPSSKFVFYGFIPKSTKERTNILNSINQNKFSSVIYESPKRIKKLLLDLKKLCGEYRKISISRELTKKYEQHIGNNMLEAVNFFENNDPRGEFTLVIGGRENQIEDLDIELIKKELIDLTNLGLQHNSAASYLAKKYKKPKNIVYKLLLNNNPFQKN